MKKENCSNSTAKRPHRAKGDMALIACPECSKEISDKADACPHCGHPMRQRVATAASKPAPAVKVVAKEGCFLQSLNLGCGIVILIVAIVVISGMVASNRTAQTPVRTPEQAAKSLKESILNGTRLEVKGWRRGNGNILLLDADIVNGSWKTITDVQIECVTKTSGGAELSRTTSTVKNAIEATKSNNLRAYALGKIDPQSKKASCDILDLKVQ